MERKLKTVFFIVAICVLFFYYQAALADKGPPDNRPPENRPPDKVRGINIDTEVNLDTEIGNYATSEASSEAFAQGGDAQGGYSEASAQGGNAVAEGGDGGNATAQGGQGGTAEASNMGVSNDSNFNSESNNTNVVLVPNNNTSDCQRVYGLSFGTGNGAGALGVPYRDKACDFEQAADDAAAHGQHEIAWYWRCHKKNLAKNFEGGTQECYETMTSMLAVKELARIEPAAAPSPPPPPPPPMEHSQYVDKEAFAEQARMTQQQFDEYEQVTDRIGRQDRIIQSQESEIERLKRIERERRAKAKELLEARK